MNKKIRKLSLNRETVRDLSGNDLRRAAGGETQVADTCPITYTCPRPCSHETFCASECTGCFTCQG
jgi:hypothetical protein